MVNGKEKQETLDTLLSKLKSSKRKSDTTTKSGRKSHSKLFIFFFITSEPIEADEDTVKDLQKWMTSIVSSVEKPWNLAQYSKYGLIVWPVKFFNQKFPIKEYSQLLLQNGILSFLFLFLIFCRMDLLLGNMFNRDGNHVCKLVRV